MRSYAKSFDWRFALAFLLMAFALRGAFAQSPSTKVTIRQLEEVRQGKTGEFAVDIAPEDDARPVLLRVDCVAGTGRASFPDGSTQMLLHRSGRVAVLGITGNDMPGALTLTAWSEGAATTLAERTATPAALIESAAMPASSTDGAATAVATAFFDVLPAALEPRVFLDGQDVTGDRLSVALGQSIHLAVFLHPGLPVESEEWSIGRPGDYTGGFLHTPMQGGPQPVVREGSSTHFYWVTPGEHRRVQYRVKLTTGETATAETFFDVEGPSFTQVQVDPVKVIIAPGATPDSSVLGLLGSGISFRALYSLPDGMLKNFTWVQLIQSDALTIKDTEGEMRCVPKSQPVAQFGAGLDTSYPYDMRNPTRDNPPLQLTPDAQEYSRVFHARMYLLWTSGLSNSIAVPLGFVDWSFSGEVVLKDEVTNQWELKAGQAGPDNAEQPFTRSQAYPLWYSLVPYSGVLTCN